MLEFIKGLFSPPLEVKDASELRAGKVIVSGHVKAAGAMLASPIASSECIAFAYRSTWNAPARGRSVNRTLRAVEAYAPRFVLALDGGEVAVTAKPSEAFGPVDHQASAHAGLSGFEATEKLICPGDRVRIEGSARRDGDGWTITPSHVQLEAAKAVGNRATRRR